MELQYKIIKTPNAANDNNHDYDCDYEKCNLLLAKLAGILGKYERESEND
jgi:hypothetical protein